MPKLPHSEPLTAELSGAVDSGAQPSIAGSKNSLRILLDRTSRLFYTYSTCKNTAVAIYGRTEDTVTDKKLISSLQGLRAVAFLSVVLSHCGAPWLGPWAISVFVALSGFLMTCNYYDRPRTAPGLRSAMTFSLQKIRKLYPLHLIMMVAALLLVLKGLWTQPSARGVLSCAAELGVSIFLLQTWIPSSRFWFCLNGVAWYLSVQAFLYAIFPCLLAILKKADTRRLRCIAAAIFCAQFLFSFAIWKAGLSGKAVFYLTYLCPLFRAGDFAISCCIGCLYRSRKEERIPRGTFSLLELAAVLFSGGCFFIAARQVGALGAVAFRYNVLFTPLCGTAGLAARRGQGSDFPAAFRKAVFVAGRAVALRLSDPSGTDPVYGVGCKQAWSYGTSCGLDPDRIFTHALPEQLLQGVGAPGAESSYKSCRTVSLWS